MRLLLLSIFCLLITTSCGFSRLTNVQNLDTTAPTAKECGSCHAEQYAEWQRTAHARAFISPQFKRLSDNYQSQNCLFCHAPGTAQNPEQEARNYNRDEGITCTSCHLQNQGMQGPHESGALFSPHAIAPNKTVNSKLDSSQLCGICHEATYEQWQTLGKNKQYPACQECHGISVRRSPTKGNNFFTDILVALEPEHEVRSHDLMTANQAGQNTGPELEVSGIDNDTIHFTLINTLPHDLPTGSFGKKELFFILSWLQADGIMTDKKKVAVPTVLIPGQQQEFTVHLAQEEQDQELSIDLFRLHYSTGKTILIRSCRFSIASLQYSN